MRHTKTVATAVLAAALAAACSGGDPAVTATGSPSPGAAAASPTPSPEPAEHPCSAVLDRLAVTLDTVNRYADMTGRGAETELNTILADELMGLHATMDPVPELVAVQDGIVMMVDLIDQYPDANHIAIAEPVVVANQLARDTCRDLLAGGTAEERRRDFLDDNG